MGPASSAKRCSASPVKRSHQTTQESRLPESSQQGAGRPGSTSRAVTPLPSAPLSTRGAAVASAKRVGRAGVQRKSLPFRQEPPPPPFCSPGAPAEAGSVGRGLLLALGSRRERRGQHSTLPEGEPSSWSPGSTPREPEAAFLGLRDGEEVHKMAVPRALALKKALAKKSERPCP